MNNLRNLIDNDLKRIIKTKELSNFKMNLYIFLFILLDRGFRAIFFYRISNHILIKKYYRLYPIFNFLNIIFNNIEISSHTEIGPGLRIMHAQCIVIGGGTIGSNVSISQGVTIGLKDKLNEYPIIGDNVHLGAGSMILGNVKIGNNSRVGANAVVINIEIPPNSIAVGIPAKVIKRGKYKYEPILF